MDKKQTRKNTRLRGFDYNSPGVYFLTLCTEHRRCILSRILGAYRPGTPTTAPHVGTGVLDGPNSALYVGTGVPDGPNSALYVGTGVLDGPNSALYVGTGVPDGPIVELLPYGKIAKKYLCQLSDFYQNMWVESYVIMPNHIHILLRIDPDPAAPSEKGPSGTISPYIGAKLRRFPFCIHL